MKTIILIGFMLFLGHQSSDAEELNQRMTLKPKIRLKINKQLAKSYIPIKVKHRKNQLSITKKSKQSILPSGSIQMINTFNNVRYAPKEVITAIKGDVINICFHCR